MSDKAKISDISSNKASIGRIDPNKLMPLPEPLAQFKFKDSAKDEFPLDGYSVGGFKTPETPEEEAALVEKFLNGLEKLFTKENNWTFLKPLLLTMDHCAQCQTCAKSCPVFESTGNNEIYRPIYRSEVFRKIYNNRIKPGSKLFSIFKREEVEINSKTLSRLYELSYRCTMCRRCAQSCPMSIDNALITRELRKLFSQELGFAPKELHEKGTITQLKAGSSTGMNTAAVLDNFEFIDEDISERTGIETHSRWDVEGADFLLIHNAGEILSWPDNPGAYSLLFNLMGYNWTLSSDLLGYDGVNYGLFYDDAQFAKIAARHYEIAKKLKVKAIVLGECGHESKALAASSERLFPDIPRISVLNLLEEIVFSGKLKFNPQNNDFPVTLHDPCNLARNLGITEPQRKILNYLAPRFREMTPNRDKNYCCGGGSGFAIMNSNNFVDWKLSVSGRMKIKQTLEAFAGEDMSPDAPKYVCAPCSNCKGQLRDLYEYYGLKKDYGIHYDGLAELVVNAMEGLPSPFIDFEMK